MTYKEKLIELLKTDKEVKEQMEKLEFGCKYKKGNKIFTICELGICNIYKDKKNRHNEEFEVCRIGAVYLYYKDSKGYFNVYGDKCETKDYFGNFEIIGLPLQERFLLIFCVNKSVGFLMDGDSIGYFYYIDDIMIRFDYTKDLDNQTEEVYQKIFEALLELNK